MINDRQYYFLITSLIGPADYKPEKALNLEHKPYYSFGDRKPLDKFIKDTPGNGVD